MKKKCILILAVLTIFLLTSSVFSAQEGTEPWSMKYEPMFNPKAIETHSGEVVDLHMITPVKGISPFVHLTLHTKDDKTFSVHLGPAWFIDRLNPPIKKGDQIEVTGSMVVMTIEEEPFKAEHVLLAQTVKRTNMVLYLRDATGQPVWQGWQKKEEEK